MALFGSAPGSSNAVLDAVRASLPRQLPNLDAHTLEKLKTQALAKARALRLQVEFLPAVRSAADRVRSPCALSSLTAQARTPRRRASHGTRCRRSGATWLTHRACTRRAVRYGEMFAAGLLPALHVPLFCLQVS
jgi:hypothetical protein